MPSLHRLFADDPLARVVTPGPRDEDELSVLGDLAEESSAVDAPLVGEGPFVAVDVPALGESGFTHFLDGAQKARLAMYYGLSPVYLAHVSAGLLPRRDREILGTEAGAYREEFDFYVPSDLPIAERLAEVGAIGIHRVPVDAEATPLQVRKAIVDAISDRRDGLEERLAQEFDHDGRLLIDGGIGKALRGGREDRFVVGVVKSHRRQYFRSRDRVQTILGLRAGQRTSAFWRERDEAQGVRAISFYLRLHSRDDAGPLHGLVRVELPPDEEQLDLVDEIAGWILHERAPSSLPDARYDRLLYPIRLVERHLKARQPSDVRLHALVGR